MDMKQGHEMQQRHEHVAYVEIIRSIYWDMQYGYEHPAWTWTWTCSMKMDMQHEHGHAA
jgi:hypothetical protein